MFVSIDIVYISVYFRGGKRKPSTGMLHESFEFIRFKQAEADNAYNAAQEKCKILLHIDSE